MQTDSQFNSFQDSITVITASIISVILVITVTFIMKTYYDEESIIIEDLHIEAARIEKCMNDDFQYANHIIDIIKNKISQSTNDHANIKEILKFYKTNPNMPNVFNWLYFAWIDPDLTIRVNNFKYSNHKELNLSFKSYVNMSKIIPGKTFYHTEILDTIAQVPSLISIEGIEENNTYLGSLMIAFDSKSLVNRINERKKNDYTNFAIIDSKLEVILKSKEIISKVGIKDSALISNNLTNIMKRLDFYSDHPREFSYINMFSGLNYYVRKMKDLPFVLLINIDHTEIQGKILNKVLLKFAEITIYTCLFLAMVISVYRRETWLRERAEKSSQIATKAMQAKTDFLAYTAHEIRSPLGFILTSSEIMQKKMFGPIPDIYEQYIDGINQNSHLILDFINDILDETYVAEGNFKIINKITDINNLISKAIDINYTRFSERKIKIVYDTNSKLPKLVCDERRIMQALNNLISNAIKYSYDHTTITINAGVENKEFFILIEDQGIGMSKADIEIAITKYGIVKNKKASNIESYGLGLVIVKKLIDAHDGKLIIESQVDVGSRITLLFPEYKIVS